ncbi:hypothetical protein OS242_03870 [Tumebacillus sp. DT12]|uniref:Uncharacterized protein n=1 Tax=Tumebacillus lacus TaxID=2995335 RepID=A0ABT3WWP9_9BACL|nr:hypothetical protein [Tumebacillus lacus]MCX7569102.1 hypothetical protein [Tumebacillus lacus]
MADRLLFACFVAKNDNIPRLHRGFVEGEGIVLPAVEMGSQAENFYL